MQGFDYVDLRDRYLPPGSHFLGRDATRVYGWDGKDPLSAKSNMIHIYRNGDVRAHIAAWERLDDIFSDLAQFSDFRPPEVPARYKEWVKRWVKFKFEVIAYFYKNWADKEIIARPIDVLVLENVPIPK
jgi:hypothetical protein